MRTKLVDLTGIQSNDIVCSIKNNSNIKNKNKWVRTLEDINGNIIDIHKLRVERSLKSGDKWILCLYNKISNKEKQKHVFYIDFDNFDKIKLRIWNK
jgi:hypothetical protein